MPRTVARNDHSVVRRAIGWVAVLVAAAIALVAARGSAESASSRDLGPASLASPILTAQLTGDKAYVVTRGVSPALLGIYDQNTKRLSEVELPVGMGAWGSTLVGTALYIGTYSPAALYRFDTGTGSLSLLATLQDQHIWDLTTAPDGQVFAGGYPSGAVYQLDPKTGQVTSLGRAAEAETYVRSVTADATTVYAGVGAHAHLVAIDRATGAKREILPPELADDAFVYDVGVTNGIVVAAMYPSGRLAFINASNPASYRIVPSHGRSFGRLMTPVGAEMFVIRDSGLVQRYDVNSGVGRDIGAPVPGEEHRGLFVRDGVVHGFADSALMWSRNPATGAASIVDLMRAGLRARPEAPESLAISRQGTVYVGGHGGIQVHRRSHPRASHRLRVAGEAKSITVVGDTIYAALYPSGSIATYSSHGKPRRRWTLGEHQIRPRDSAWDRKSGALVVGTQPDYGLLGGALSVLRPRKNRLDVYRNLIANQSVSSVATSAGVAFVGSEIFGGPGAVPKATRARLAAFDLARKRKLWELVPIPQAKAILHLAVSGHLLVGTTETGHMFVVDIRSRRVVHKAVIGRGEVALTAQRGFVYGASHDRIVRMDPDTYSLHVVRDRLAAEPLSRAMLIGDAKSRLYTLSKRNLLEVRTSAKR